MYNTWGVTITIIVENKANVPKNAWFLPYFVAANLYDALLGCCSSFLIIHGSNYGSKYPCGWHKLCNEGSEKRIHWLMPEISLYEEKVGFAAKEQKKWLSQVKLFFWWLFRNIWIFKTYFLLIIYNMKSGNFF